MKTIKLTFALLLVSTIAAISQPVLEPLAPDGFVTLEQIVNDFSNSETAALQKYNGMRICVHGRVGTVAPSKDSSGELLAVHMQLPDRPTPDVKALFNADFIPSPVVAVADNDTKATVYHADWNGNLSDQSSFIVPGVVVAIRGTFDHFVAGDIILKNSFMLAPDVLERKLSEHGLATK
ncbi:MAG: hypothetical protein ACOVLK_01035 [Terrimicrobiaceae bacterium]|jgi:hypothetical protein